VNPEPEFEWMIWKIAEGLWEEISGGWLAQINDNPPFTVKYDKHTDCLSVQFCDNSCNSTGSWDTVLSMSPTVRYGGGNNPTNTEVLPLGDFCRNVG
jgi:hypothetical protein